MEASIARFATRNGFGPRGGAHRTEPRRGAHAEPPTERRQEELWAACISDEPKLITDIVNFITSARARIVESPPVAPDDEPKPETGEGQRRK